MPNFYRDNDDIQFHMRHLDLNRIIDLAEEGFKDKGVYDYAPANHDDARDSYDRTLDILGAICGDYIAPRAAEVDKEGAHYEDGRVRYAKGTAEALDMLRKADLMGFTLPRRYGGINFPGIIYMIAVEMVARADGALMNLFGLQDIAETIYRFGDEDQRKRYLPRFAAGEVSGCMALTEPDAGSDLQAVMLKAYQDKEGQWRLRGVKRFITNGCAEIALVLARTEEGSTDARGLSMFIYEREKGMRVRRIENKLGIHGSPTCELQFNDAPAELCGQRRMGLFKYVMSLMNGARLGIAAQGLGIAEAAYSEAEKYSRERIQFKKTIGEIVPVAEMLINMRVKIEAGRTLLYETSVIVDIKNSLEQIYDKDPERAKGIRDEYKKYSGLAALLTPISKAYNTEMANQVCYDAIQIHGGTGFMQEFGAERHYRDARITNIYEGTTQLQVVAAIGGVLKGTAVECLDSLEASIDFSQVEYLRTPAKALRDMLAESVEYMLAVQDLRYRDFHSRRLVEIAAYAIIGHLMVRDATRSERKKDVAKCFFEYALPECRKMRDMAMSGKAHMLEKKEEILRSKN